MVDINNARLDLFDVDDFINSIEKEAQLLNEKFHEKLEQIKHSTNGLKDFLISIGAMKKSREKLISPWITIGLIDYETDKQIGQFKEETTVVNYTTKSTSKNELTININPSADNKIKFNKHILITTDRNIYNNIANCGTHHTSTAILLVEKSGTILESKTYKNVKSTKHTTYMKPSRVLNITVKGPTEPIEKLQRSLYWEFCIKTNTHEFGNTYSILAPTNDAQRNPYINSAFLRMPMSIHTCENKVTLSNRFMSKLENDVPTKSVAMMETLRDRTSSSSNSDVFIPFLHNNKLKAARRYFRQMRHKFTIETDIIIGESVPDRIINTLIHHPYNSAISESTIKKMYKCGRYNEIYYKGERNIHLNCLTPLQKTFLGRLTHVNQHYKLNLKYHQLYSILNTIPHRVSILKADVGLGKSRAAIAYCMTKEGKHNLIITEPGNVLELQREFKEQLNLDEVPNIIKKVTDLNCLKQFNLIGYSTLCKIFKHSTLKDLPSPVTKIEIRTEANGLIRNIDTTNNITYWEAFRNVGACIINDTYINKTSFISKAITKGNSELTPELITLTQTISLIYDLAKTVEHNEDITPTVDATITLFKSKNLIKQYKKTFLEHFKSSLVSSDQKYKEDSLYTSNIGNYSNDLSISYRRIIDCDSAIDMNSRPLPKINNSTVSSGIALMMCSIIGSIHTIGRQKIEDTFIETHSYFYKLYEDFINIILDEASKYELTPDQKLNLSTAFTKASANSTPNNGRFQYAKGLRELMCNIINRSMVRTVDMTFETVGKKVGEMRIFSDRMATTGTETGRNARLSDMISKLCIKNMSDESYANISKSIKMIALILKKIQRDVDNQKLRAKYRLKTMASKMSGTFNTAIFDECHSIKNISSTRSMISTQLRAKNYLFMSATPVGNHMGELLSYLVVGYGLRSLKHMIDLEARRFNDFRNPTRQGRKMYTINVDRDEITYELDITNPLSDITKKGFPAHRLNALVDNNMTRVIRSDSNVVQDSAFKFDVKEYRSYSVPSEEHMALYAAQMEIIYEASRTGKYEDSREALSTLTNLVKISEIPHLISEEFNGFLTNKQNDIVELGRKYLSEGRSVIIFTQFKDMVQLIAKELSTRTSSNVYMLHENLTPDKRFSLIDAFRKQEGNACIVGTVNNLGKGFNLACADVIIMSDVPWSPLLYAQSIGRILRPDQEGNPEVIMVMNKYMIDMYKFDTIRAKLNMIKKYIDRDETIQEKDTHKVDYKQFLLKLLDKAVKDGVMTLPETESQTISRGV